MGVNHIKKLNDVGVLAVLECFNFLKLLNRFRLAQVPFGRLFDGYLLSGLVVDAELNNAKLALAQHFDQFVLIFDSSLAVDVLDALVPHLLLLLGLEEEVALLVGWEAQVELVEILLFSILIDLLITIILYFSKSAG